MKEQINLQTFDASSLPDNEKFKLCSAICRQKNMPALKKWLHQVPVEWENFRVLDAATNFDWLEGLKEASNYSNPGKHFFCLRDAASHNNIEMLKYLVEEKNADISMNDYGAVSIAVMGDNLEAFQFFVQKGFPLQRQSELHVLKRKNISNKEDDRPNTGMAVWLHAWACNSLKCMQWLLSQEDLKTKFFLEGHITHDDTDLLYKMQKDPTFTNMVMKELIQCAPQEYEKLKANVHRKYKDEKVKEYNIWFDWLEMSVNMPEKNISKKSNKI